MTYKFELDSVERIVAATNYRCFIKTLIEEKSKQKRFGYADIARIGGFSARSFPRDVTTGSKRISLQSLPKMIRGLGLKSDLAEYFRILVEIEEHNCRNKILDESKLIQIKSNLTKRILRKRKYYVGDSDKAFTISSIPIVYAALGSSETGANIKEICGKTRLEQADVVNTLDMMVQKGLIQNKGKYFIAIENHASFDGLKSEIFKKHFIKTAQDSITMANKNLSSSEKLFLSSAFSVREKDLISLKEDLRSLLLRYIDTSENCNGDRVINLVASLF